MEPNFTLQELVFLVPLAGLCLFTLVRNWRASPVSIWSPMSLMAMLFLFYSVIGPIYFILAHNTVLFGQDMRPQFWLGWMGSLVSYLAMGAGYLSYQGRKNFIGKVCSDDLLEKYSIMLTALSFGAMFVYMSLFRTDNLFNPLARDDDSTGGEALMGGFAFSNYMVILVNLSIPAIVLCLLVWLQRRSAYALLMFIVVSLLGMAFFVSSGFRFRIVWATVAVLAAYYLWKKARPNLLLLGVGGVVFIGAMGLIGITRNYWAGLSLDRAEGASASSLIDRGFDETGIFMSVGSVIEAVPDRVPHTYFDPFWITLTFPVPRNLWPGKPESKTLQALSESFGSKDAVGAGLAMPFFAEWYVAFGWPGLIGSSFLLGLLCKRLWVWFHQRREDNLVILGYTSTLGFLYFVFSRGYTPIMVMNFVFGLLPFFALYGWLRRRAFYAWAGRVLRFQQNEFLAERAQQRRMARSGGESE